MDLISYSNFDGALQLQFGTPEKAKKLSRDPPVDLVIFHFNSSRFLYQSSSTYIPTPKIIFETLQNSSHSTPLKTKNKKLYRGSLFFVWTSTTHSVLHCLFSHLKACLNFLWRSLQMQLIISLLTLLSHALSISLTLSKSNMLLS